MRQIAWTSPAGDSLILNGGTNGYRVMAAATRGLSSPPYRFTAATHAGIGGATLQALQADQRTVTLGMQVEAATVGEFRRRWRALVRAMRPLSGDGALTVTDEWGRARTLTCRYAGGLEGDSEAEFAGTMGRAVVTLAAFDPWFYGAPQTMDVGLGAPTPFFPIFPLRLSPSTVQGTFTVDLSDADAPAYPLWTVTGPGTALTLTNETTGRSLVVNAALGAGETMVIDTRPERLTVRRGDGANLMGAVSGDPSLWPLVDAVNVVSAQLTGATAASRIVGRYSPRYAGL